MAIIYGIADSEKQLLKNYPKEVKKMEDIPQMYEKFKEKLDEPVSGIFAGIKKWNRKRQVNKFENNKDNLFHPGAKGENKVIEELSKLSNDYHVLCGLRIELPYFVTYNGEKNLRSAQMDFVVVSTKGIFMIEVKNWSNDYVQNHEKRDPYEQTDRAGRILWIKLQNVIKNVRVTNVLLSIQGNIQYNENYRAVFVTSLERINNFLEKRENILSEKDVQKVVDKLKNRVAL